MALGNNSALITTAMRMDVTANNAIDTFDGGEGATAFVVADGNVGDDEFLNFGSDDTLITGKFIFDGNGDGFIAFGDNGALDIDRTRGGNSSSARGPDQLTLSSGGDDLLEVRYLGTKGNQFVYADASTLRNLAGAYGDGSAAGLASDTNAGTNVIEGTVADDTIDASRGAVVILQDNLLGLNLGGDTITGFGRDDLLATTDRLFDSDDDGDVDFFSNRVLDITGPNPEGGDPQPGTGGQLDFNTPDLQSLDFLGTGVINGKTYYYYGTSDSIADLAGASA